MDRMNADRPADPPALFRRYIARSVHAALDRINRDASVLEDDQRARALHVLGFAMGEMEAWPAAQELMQVMASKMARAGYRDEWIPYLEQGAMISHARGDKKTEAEFHLHLGQILQLRGRFDAAAERFEQSRAGYAAVGDDQGQARALSRLALIACMKRSFEEATRLSMFGLALLDQDDPERAAHYNVLGRVAFMQEEWERAEAFYSKALALREEEGDKHKIASNLRDYGVVLYAQQRLDESIATFSRAAALFEELGDRQELAAVRNNLGNAYYYQKRLSLALNCYEQARETLREIGGGIDLAVVCMNIGLVCNLLKQWRDAKRAFVASMDYWPPDVDRFAMVNALDGMGVAALHQANYEQASDFLNQALALLEEYRRHPAYGRYQALVLEHMQAVEESRRANVEYVDFR